MQNENDQSGDELELTNGEAPPVEEDPDQVTATQKFNWPDPENDCTRTYWPGQIVKIPEAAAWALETRYGEQRGLQSPARSHVINSPDNKARNLDAEGGQTKGKRKR